MSSRTREHPRPRPRPGGKSFPPKERNLQNAKYIHGVTVIDRSKGASLPKKGGEAQVLIPSLIVGVPKCRFCYEDQPCECGQPLFVSDTVNVYWTESSRYFKLGFPAVRKIENIAMAEAKNLGMPCVVLRSEHHNTATEFTLTGKRTGRYVPADWHVTLNHGDDTDKLLLQGHVYLFMGKNGDTTAPQCKLAPGNRTILEPHEILEQLTLEDAACEVYWGVNGSCGWVSVDEGLPPTIE